MRVETRVPVEEYLASTYEPDREYLDGEIVERNIGGSDHAGLQGLLLGWLFSRRKELGIHVFPELRIQVTPTRFHVPDIAVITRKISGRILREAPFICVEILSPEDRAGRLESKIDDYLNFGVAHIWVIDPLRRCAWMFGRDGKREAVTILTAVEPTIELPIADLFRELDETVE